MGFLAALTNYESGDRNIPNTTQETSSGPAQGYFQITTGTWNAFAPDAGVDLSKYPTAISAPPDVQWKVASTIPLRRWAPETLNYLRKQGFSLDPGLSLGENVAANGGSPAKWFSGAAYGGETDTPSGRFDLGAAPQANAVDPFAEFAAAEKAASGVAPTNAMTGVANRFDLGASQAGADPFAEFAQPSSGTPPVQITPPLANAQPGPNGLVWDANGGHDPKTGELVVAGQPFQASAHPQILSGAMGLLGGIPIAGPYLQGGVERAAAGIDTLRNGAPYADNLGAVQQEVAAAQNAYPKTSTVGNVAGGIAGTVPLMAAAPEAFGIGTGFGTLPNALIAGATNSGLGAIDAAVRGGSPMDVGRAAAIGGAAGVGGMALGGGANALARALSGGVMPSEDAALAALARGKYGIPLTNDQLSHDVGQGFLRSASDRLPLSGAQSDIANTQAAFNRAVAGTIGEGGAAKLTPAVMTAAKTRIGQAFDDIASRTTIKVTPQFDEDLLGVVSQAQDSGMSADELRPINKIFDNVLDAIDPNTRTISGDVYQTLTRTGTPLANALKSANPNIKMVAGEIKDALDDALGRSASPQDLQEFQTAKSQWRNLKTIEANVAQNGGDVSPARLANDINNSRFSKAGLAYGNGGDLGELAAIGQRFMKQPQSSGTAERLAGLGLLGGLMEGGNALLHGSLAGMAHGAIVPAAAIAANRWAVNPLLRSQWLANQLINRSLPGVRELGPSVLPALGALTGSGTNALLSAQ